MKLKNRLQRPAGMIVCKLLFNLFPFFFSFRNVGLFFFFNDQPFLVGQSILFLIDLITTTDKE